MSSYIRARGVNKLIAANNKLIKRLEDNTDFEEILDEIVKLARERCPVKTGDMEASIYWTDDGGGLYSIICAVPYSLYIEYGTRYFPIGSEDSPRKYKSSSGKMASVPFMRSAIWDINRKFPNKMFGIINVIYMR